MIPRCPLVPPTAVCSHISRHRLMLLVVDHLSIHLFETFLKPCTALFPDVQSCYAHLIRPHPWVSPPPTPLTPRRDQVHRRGPNDPVVQWPAREQHASSSAPPGWTTLLKAMCVANAAAFIGRWRGGRKPVDGPRTLHATYIQHECRPVPWSR